MASYFSMTSTFSMVGMYCFHSPVVKCQKMANTHRATSAHAALVCSCTALAQPSSVYVPCTSKPVSIMNMISAA